MIQKIGNDVIDYGLVILSQLQYCLSHSLNSLPDKHWLLQQTKLVTTISCEAYTSREEYGSAVSSSSYISSCDSDSVDSGGVQVVDGVGVAR